MAFSFHSSIKSKLFSNNPSLLPGVKELVLSVGNLVSRGITASALKVIENRVSLVDLRGLVRYVQRTCDSSPTHFPFASYSIFLSPFTITLLTIPSCIGQGGIPIRNAWVTTVPLENFAIKLKTIIRDKGMGDPKSSDNISPNESFGILWEIAHPAPFFRMLGQTHVNE